MRIAVPAAIDPAALAGWRPGRPLAAFSGETMGTTWRVLLAAPPGFDGGALVAAIEARLESILAQVSHWRADSQLSRFGRAPAGTRIEPGPDFARVIDAALDIARRSGGAFDPAIGALVAAWGFGPHAARALPPSPAALAQARARSGHRHLAHVRGAALLRQPGGLALDLSGIAKGYGVDALAAVLRAHGCDHALVEIGGEFAGIGLKPDGDPWWVELETPAPGIAPLRLALHQAAVATSGDYVAGRHTIDPRSGLPVRHALSVSVVHASAMLADGWATALGVLEPAAMRALARREGLAVRALLREGESDGIVEWISPALAAWLDDAVCEAAAPCPGAPE